MASGVNAVVVASAGCGSRMKDYGDLLIDDNEYAGRALEFSSMVKDIHEFLVELPFVIPTTTLDYRVTYQDSCHLGHAQRITEAPREILRSIPGVTFVEMEDSTRCCGAGGTYSLMQRDFSLRILDAKMDAVVGARADVLTTANPGCVIQLEYGVRRSDMDMQVRYVTDLLDEAYQSQ